MTKLPNLKNYTTTIPAEKSIGEIEQNQKSTTRSRKSRDDFREQAYKIGWRIIKDWIHSQLSIIATDMIEIEQVLLPYAVVDVVDGNYKTLSEAFLSGDVKYKNLLPEFTG